MGVQQFSEFKDELQVEMGENTALTSLGGINFYGRWINSAYITLATQNKMWGIRRSFTFPELEDIETDVTVDGSATIDCPSDALIIRHVWDSTNDVKLIGIPFATYITYSGRADTSAEGKPTQWVRNGDNIYLYPTPDDEYTIYTYYRKRPAKLVDDDDTTVIGVEWDEPILRLAKSLALRKLQQYDEAKKEKEEFIDMIRGIVGIYDQESYDRQQHRQLGPYHNFGY